MGLTLIMLIFHFLQKLLLDLRVNIQQGHVTVERIRAELKNTFPEWNIPAYVTGGEDEVNHRML